MWGSPQMSRSGSKIERYPLMDWGITEKEALRICYDRGYDFGGLYQIYRRCSCWCCPLQGIGELRKLPGSITRSYGSGCGKWTSGRWHSSAPARWGNSRRIGVWNGWNSDLRQKRSSFLFHPRRRSVNDDVSRTE